MSNIKELESYAKETGILKPDELLCEPYAYDKIASVWKAYEMIKLIEQTKHEKFHSILEVGFGSGMVLQAISEYFGISYSVGIDMDKSVLIAAKERWPKSKYIFMGACNLSFLDNSFDLVVLSDIIEHVKYPAELLEEIGRVSKYSVYKI